MSLLASTPRSSSAVALAIVLATAASLTGCKVFKTNCEEDDRTCLGGGYQRAGDACSRTGDCAVGLDCIEGACEFSASTKKGRQCVATAECADGLYCSKALTCQPISADAQGAGGTCSDSGDCKKGLVCDLDLTTLFTEGPFGELSPQCQAITAGGNPPPECSVPMKCVKRGDGDTGDECKTAADCMAGLYCATVPGLEDRGSICGGPLMALPQEPITLPEWDGVSCPEDSSKSPTAYFEVPRSGGKNKDFYRLPFPNDIRVKGGKVDLSSHPRPPAKTDVPAVERFLDAASTLNGFATNPVILFRFSEPYETNRSTVDPSIRVVDITMGSPTYNQSPPTVDWGLSGYTSNYICPNWIALRPGVGAPLLSNTTYAAILTRTMKTAGGKAYARSADLDAMLSAARPSDPDLGAAYDKYAPLRAWLVASNTSADDILNVAVFTTQDANGVTPALHAAVAKEGAPKLSDMVVCGDGVKSPCEDVTGRGACHTADPDFTEIHGRISLPIFQEGEPPYEKPEQLGGIKRDAMGNVVKVSNMSVCFALSVPKKPMPAAGYPVVLYAHGTGGSFAGQTAPGGLAHELAVGAAPAALFAIDMPEHGNRRGASLRPPEDLFFNFLNPVAARGNVLQGAADLMSLALLVQGDPIPKSASHTASDIAFDGTRVLIYGHSQGATHAAVMLPFEGGATAGVLSGVGGHLTSSMLNKKKPVDIASILPFLLFDAGGDSKLVGGAYNPILAIIQMFYESADPVNYGRLIAREPSDLAPTGHHLFMTYGLTDSFSPEETQEAYARSARLTAVNPLLTVLDVPSKDAPLFENQTVGGVSRTVGMRQYDPTIDFLGKEPNDGHFVASATKSGHADVMHFIEQVMEGKSPEIGVTTTP